MTEQQTLDREKKIAKIREAYHQWLEKHPFAEEYTFTVSTQEFEALLSELDRIQQEYAEERAAHNAHVTELCELEKENRKLREERDKLQNDLLHEIIESLDQAVDMQDLLKKLEIECKRWNFEFAERMKAEEECRELREQLQSAQQEIEHLRNLARQERELADHWMRKHHDDVVKLREECDKLIEGLKKYKSELYQRWKEAHDKWEKDADMYAQGEEAAYDIAENKLDEILKEIGVTVE